MMVDIETIGVAMDTSGLKAGQRELDNTTTAAKRTADAADDLTGKTQKTGTEFKALESTLGTVRTVLATLGVTVLAKEFFSMADAVTTLQNQLKLATGSGAAAGQVYEQLYDIAQRSRVSFTELGSTYAAIARAGSQLGVSQDRLLNVTEAIGNAMTISGGSAASMQAALVQLSQGLSSGTLRGEELNSVMEQTPRLAKALADGLGVPIGKLREMGAAGEITAEQVIMALESQTEALSREVQGATLTVGQAFTQLGNATVKFVGEADAATGASGAFASGLSAIAVGISGIGEAVREHETAIATTFGVLAGAGVLAALPAMVSGFAALKGAVVALGVVLAANPVVLALLGIGAAVGGFMAYNNAMSDTAEGIRKTIASLEDANRSVEKSIYGPASEEAMQHVQRRKDEISKLRQELALLDAQSLDTRAEDKRLAAYNASAIATDNLKNKLNGTLTALSGVNDKYAQHQAQLVTLYEAKSKGLITEEEYLAAVGKINAALEKQYAGTKKAKSEDQSHSEVMKGVIARREAFTAAVIESMSATEMASIEQHHWNKTMAAGQVEIDKLLNTERERTAVLQADVTKQREANEVIGLSRLEIARLEAARLDDAAATLEQTAAINEQMGDQSGLTIEYKKQAAALRELSAGKVAGAYSEEVSERRKQDISEWQKHWDQVSQGMVDSLMQGGKSVAEYLKGLFRTLVLKPILSAVVNPVAAAFTGAMGMPGVASAATGGAGMLGSLGSMGSMLGGFGTAAGYGASALFAGNGLGALSGGMSMLGAGSISQGLGMIAGVAGPILAGVTLISSLLKSTKSPGEQHTGGFYSSTGADGMDAALSITGGNDAYARDLIKRANPEIKSVVSTTVESVLQATQDRAKALGFDISLGIDAGLAANTNGKGKDKNTFGYFNITSGGEVVSEYSNRELGADFGQATAKFAADMAEAAAKVVLAGTDFQKAGETAVQTLERLTAIQGMSEALNPLGGIFSMIANASVGARDELIALAGGIDTLMGQAGSFVKNYYSQDEQMGVQARMISDALAAVGIDASSLRERQDYRQLVESFKQADLEDPTKQQQIAALLGLGDQFAGLSDYLRDNNLTLAEAIQNAPDIPILQSMLDPQRATAQATQQMSGQLSGIAAQLTGIQQAADAAAAAAAAAASAAGQAASAAGSAAGAASSAAASADLAASRPAYSYNIGEGA